MRERPRVPGGQEHKRPARSDKLRLGKRMPNTRAERGVALIMVLIAVSFVSIIVIACITLVTMAARTTSWSLERTKALYAAEAGINHWLFQASVDGKRGSKGKSNNSGRGKDSSWNEILRDLEVSGEIDGISYSARATASELDGFLHVVSVARTARRDIQAQVTVKLIPEAWRHVIYAREPWFAPTTFVNNPSQWSPSSGPNKEVWVSKFDSELIPAVEWGDKDIDGYHPRIAPVWDPPQRESVGTLWNGVLYLDGEGPFYVVNKHVREIRAHITGINGDLYVENCTIDQISGSIAGNVLVRNESHSGEGVKAITGDIHGSIYIEPPPSGNQTSIGSWNEAAHVGGAVYLKGERPGAGRIRDVLKVFGPQSFPFRPSEEKTHIQGGVFAQDASVLVSGSVRIDREPPYPAILATSCVVLFGLLNDIEVHGPIYSEGKWPFDLPNDVASEIDSWIGNSEWRQGAGLGVAMIGLGLGGPGTVKATGNIVSQGPILLVGNVSVSYDSQLMTNPPPFFTGGRLSAGLWSANLQHVAGD